MDQYEAGTGPLFDAAAVRDGRAVQHLLEFRFNVQRRWSLASHGRYGDGVSVLEPQVESLSQRELRNESGKVLRAVSEGSSFVLTNNGVPVGRIVPLDAQAPKLRIARPAKRVGGWAALAPRRTSDDRSMDQVLDDLREDRV